MMGNDETRGKYAEDSGKDGRSIEALGRAAAFTDKSLPMA
jgi:hypothetical protein